MPLFDASSLLVATCPSKKAKELASQLGDVQAECVARVEKTKQAASLRQMLTKKNVLVKQLRDTLIANGTQP